MARRAVARPGSRAVLLRAGALAGLMSGLVGVGGGVVMVPALVSRRSGLSQRVASGTSLAAILPIAIVGAVTYAVQRQIDGLAAVCIIPGSVGGAVLGARLTRAMSERRLALGFALISLALATRLLIPAGLSSGGAPVTATALHVVELLTVGLVAGVASGLFGIGGGIVVVPMLTLGFGVSQQLAQGSSLVAIVPTGLSGAVAHWRMGQVDARAALWLAIPGLLTAIAGALLATHLPETPLRVLFAAYMVFTAIRVAVR